MDFRLCSTKNCQNGHYGRGLCRHHYDQWRRRSGNFYTIPNDDKAVLLRFWSKVEIKTDPNQCWEWKAGLNNKGYGTAQATYKGVRFHYAHRLSFYIAFGVNAGEGKFVICHKCDNPKCVNPRHLFMDTMKGNMADMCHKNRTANRKLTNEQAMEIRKRFQGRYGEKRQLAKEYGVSDYVIWAILANRSFIHIPADLLTQENGEPLDNEYWR